MKNHTEDIHPSASDIDALSVEQIIEIMNEEDLQVVQAVSAARDSIAGATEEAISAIRAGGSVIYVGAGTSGRLGVLDASEMPPTFGVSPDLVRAVIAGGEKAITTAVEGAEDDEDAGRRAVQDVTDRDMVLGITASGRTPFVLSALREGKRRGARCWLFSCNEVRYDFLDGTIPVIVGPEVVAGSTRLKAGTATKMVLNMISTAAMVKTGRVYRGYMVDVVPSNQKLVNRALRIIREITGCGPEEAETLLKESKGNPKTAIVMHRRRMEYEEALKTLEEKDGSLREAVE